VTFVSGAKLGKKGCKEAIQFSRRYLDTNRVTYEVCFLQLFFTLKTNSGTKFHTKTNEYNFDTSLGKQISSGLQELSSRFDLSAQFGTAPQDYKLFT